MAANPVVSEILRQGRRQPRKRVKAALETGIVESGLSNPSGGDADSAGWRQERRSLYPNPTNIRASVRRFFSEAAQHDAPGKPARRLAADVQRPREDLRGRYGQVRGQAEAILAGREPAAGAPASTPGSPSYQPGRVDLRRVMRFDQAGFEQATQRAKIGEFLASRGRGGGLLFRSGLLTTGQPDRADFTTSRLRSKLTPGRLVGGDAAALGDLGPGAGDVEKAAHAARKLLGVREAGGNRGGRVDRLERRFGMVGQPWCGVLVGTALRKAGVKGITARVASVDAIEQDARAGTGGFRSWHGPQHARAGDALVTAKGQHVGLVVAVDRKRGTIKTIEGNTGSGEVARRTHKMSDVYGVARPRYRRR